MCEEKENGWGEGKHMGNELLGKKDVSDEKEKYIYSKETDHLHLVFEWWALKQEVGVIWNLKTLRWRRERIWTLVTDYTLWNCELLQI